MFISDSTFPVFRKKLINYIVNTTVQTFEYPGNWVLIWRAIVYYARAANAFGAETKCRHCIHRLQIFHFV